MRCSTGQQRQSYGGLSLHASRLILHTARFYQDISQFAAFATSKKSLRVLSHTSMITNTRCGCLVDYRFLSSWIKPKRPSRRKRNNSLEILQTP
ncbi:hypothetical protein BDV37DRAFT_87465 [Aspergillus pseudonomiae]|uniref:Uncharacterized protein n=1 Tax=Aspergillus pseudonomiae TaxID=1506151 RepID=A0A5N7DH49_9EURO|nr:uncharacterized protein BDV37DRAFT_87465 [Aspergillus pseudonomiae]KAE8405741.1 hypothetical protein BDV37DRAFT_87465 [Aspergillus pseudonomiae]